MVIDKTAKVAKPISGDKLYQERARKILPLLVRQAEAGKTILYSNLVQEVEMPNPRNLNYPLGSIGRTLENLSKEWKENIPPIQCLVVNKKTGLPGEGIGWFLTKKEEFSVLSKPHQKRIVEAELARVFAYPRWNEVLTYLSLSFAKPDFLEQIKAASHQSRERESEDHILLKDYVARNPELIGLPSNTPVGAIESGLPSGDFLDVSFMSQDSWIAVEVKSAKSKIADITRGLFQCVKYLAVMEAVQISIGKNKNSRAVLVLGSKLPKRLVSLRNLLNVEVVEEIAP